MKVGFMFLAGIEVSEDFGSLVGCHLVLPGTDTSLAYVEIPRAALVQCQPLSLDQRILAAPVGRA
jgi:hypothetical protein